MRIDVLTLFPGIFRGPLNEAILYKAQEVGLLTVNVLDLREFTDDVHRTADDYPFGGGPGMVLKPEPIFRAIDAIRSESDPERVILLTPQGRVFNQQLAWELSACRQLVLICGRYEGVDERVREALVTDEISIGDYVLSGGELPALVLIDAVARLVPGVVGERSSVLQDSFADGLLEGPQYTRPRQFRDLSVPDVLLSGNHELIRRWRRKESLRRTLVNRPDLLATAKLTAEDEQLLAEIQAELGGGEKP